jgi:arsenate reductase
MAEAYLRHIGADQYEAMSAGTEPKGLNPLAVDAMAEIGIDISHQKSKDVGSFLGQNIPFVITVCDHAKQKCPIFPGAYKFLHWSIDDPAEAKGTHDERLVVFRRVRDELIRKIDEEFLVPGTEHE